jgi:hypothetical protein
MCAGLMSAAGIGALSVTNQLESQGAGLGAGCDLASWPPLRGVGELAGSRGVDGMGICFNPGSQMREPRALEISVSHQYAASDVGGNYSSTAMGAGVSLEGSMVWKPSDLAASRSCAEAETKMISVFWNMSRATRAAAS